jgi:hypothetical protein
MADPFRRALTRRRRVIGSPTIIDEPDETLVYVVKFGVGMTACLTAIEIASLAFLHSWNSEVFASITGLSGTVIGVFVGRKAQTVRNAVELENSQKF